MATQNLAIQAQYGIGDAWNAFTTTDSNNGDYNRFFIGGSSTRGRTRFKVTIPSSLAGVPTKIVIGMKTDEDNCTPGKMRSYLSTNASVDSGVDNWISAGAILKTSYWYSDKACTTRAPSYMSSPAFIYCSFTYSFTKGGTYYIGVFPYGSDSAAQTDTSYSDVWFRGRNMSGYLTAYVEYTANYTVSYNANGGTGAPSSQTKTYGVNLTLSSTRPTKAATTSTFTITGNGNGGVTKTITATKTISYTFTGWATSSTGSVAYQPGGTYSANASVTLYAIWTSSVSYSNNTIAALGTTTRTSSAGQYTVTFDANGGSCDTGSLAAARTSAYSFLGWGSSSSATSNLSSSTSYTSATTVYARWSSSATTTTAPITLPIAERAVHAFLGWAESASAESGMIGSYTPSKNITLYAVWETRTPVMYIPFIDNGSSYVAYQALVDNGTSWV